VQPASQHRTTARQAHQQVTALVRPCRTGAASQPASQPAQNYRQTGTPAGDTKRKTDVTTTTAVRRHLLSANERLTKALRAIPYHLASYMPSLS